MVSSALGKQRHQGDKIALLPSEVPTVEIAWRDGPAPDRTAERESSDPRIRIVSGANPPELPVAELRWLAKNNQVASNNPSIFRRMFRVVGRFCIAVVIGIGATLAWQSHGDQAKEMIGTWATSLGRLLSASTTKPAPEVNIAATQTATSVQVSVQDVARPSTETTPVPAGQAAPPAEGMQQLDAIARNLAVVQRSVEQLTAKQEEMAHNIATLQAAKQDIRTKISSGPQSSAVPLPPRKKTPAVAPAQSAAQSTAEQPSSPRPTPIPRPPVSLLAE
jgi:hypothetical protein